MLDWTIIFTFSSFGILMGILSILGFTKKIEFFLWLGAMVATALLLPDFIVRKYFLHAFFVGLLWGIFNSVLQSAFFPTYLKNNPQHAEQFEKAKDKGNPRVFVVFMGPIIGAITGAATGGLLLLFDMI